MRSVSVSEYLNNEYNMMKTLIDIWHNSFAQNLNYLAYVIVSQNN